MILDLLEDLIEARGWGYERIDGTITGATRQQAIDRFSDPASESFLFLITTRAGGVGINLTAADTVIMFDSDWNPQNDVQAMARCHRIGQTKTVQVYKLCTNDTYEQAMLQAANHKLGLEHAVIKQGGFESTGGGREKAVGEQSARQKASTIERLLRAGAHMLSNKEHDQRISAFDQSSIEDILTHYGETRLVGGDAPADGDGGSDGAAAGGSSSTFALASFVSDESGASIDLDDPEFWSKMLPEVPQLDAAAAAEMDAAAAASGADRLRVQPKKPEETDLDRVWARGRERKRERDEDDGGDVRGGAEVEDWTHEEMEAVQAVVLAVGHSRAPVAILQGGEEADDNDDAGADDPMSDGDAAQSGGKADGAIDGALRALAGRREEPREVKKACDAVLLGWLRHASHAARAPFVPPALHSFKPSVVRRVFDGDGALPNAKRARSKPPPGRVAENVIALGCHPRPQGRGPSNDQGVQLIWAYARGKWVDGTGDGTWKGVDAIPGDGDAAAAEAADLDRRLAALATGLRSVKVIAKATEEEVGRILAEAAAEAAAADAAADDADEADPAVMAEGVDRAITRLDTRLKMGLAEPDRFESYVEAGVATGHLEVLAKLEEANREEDRAANKVAEAAEAAAEVTRRAAAGGSPGGCAACRGRHVKHTCGRSGWGTGKARK